ncbi:MAG: glycosyltransferase family 2 protein [Zetaproteobacteria bacterium]|nr:MAG: glycosyltransferase family 2 protein [Zetaproteobacteria bacterium]
MTYNEAEKIADAIASVIDWADEVVVVDSFSSDGTDAIARELGARVEQIPFRTFGQIRNAAIAACRFAWIFSLDADERCTDAAAAEIQAVVANPEFDAYFIPRRNWYLGRWVRHGGWYPDYRQPQLFRRGAITFDESAEVHEEYTIHGTTGHLTQEIIQFPFKDIEQMIHKMQRYSTLGAEKYVRQGRRGGILKGLLHGLWGFFRLYVLKLGFLDGRAGFIIALGNFEGTFYRYAKLAARQQGWLCKPPADPTADGAGYSGTLVKSEERSSS